MPSGVSRRDTVRIAQRFIAGYERRLYVLSPVGTTEGVGRPYGTWVSSRPAFPALKRWAIFGCPSGTPRNSSSGTRPVSMSASARAEARGSLLFNRQSTIGNRQSAIP